MGFSARRSVHAAFRRLLRLGVPPLPIRGAGGRVYPAPSRILSASLAL